MNPLNIMSEAINGDRLNDLCQVAFDAPRKGFGHELIGEDDFVVFCKINFLKDVFDKLKNSKQEYVLVTGNGDCLISEEMFNSKPGCIKKWFGMCVNFRNENLVPIPIGLERPSCKCGSSDIEVLKNQLEKPRQDCGLVYLNFNQENNLPERSNCCNYFNDKKWVTCEKKRVPFPDFIKSVYSHKFVISPSGAGNSDCHRTWEALYMGSIPIVKRSVFMESFIELPIVIIDEWEEVTQEFLLKKHSEISGRSYDKGKLFLSYWRKRFYDELDKIKTGRT